MDTYFFNGVVQLYQADAREIPLPDKSVHCVVTSPPYFGLRVYQGNDDRGIGLEASIEDYVANLVDVFAEVKRVLRDDGVCWVNLGDSYSGSWGNYNPGSDGHGGNGQRPKDTERFSRPAYDGVTKHRPAASYFEQGNQLCIPERVAMALQADGWIKRDTIIWAKKSAMPESLAGWRWEQCRVKTKAQGKGSQASVMDGGPRSRDMSAGEYLDSAEWAECPGCPKCAANDGLVLRKGSWRTTSAHEYIYMLTKGMGYYADGEAVKTANTQGAIERFGKNPNMSIDKRKYSGHEGEALASAATKMPLWSPNGANRRSVWNDISPEPYGGAHFATFPSDLPRICIQASTSEKGVCSECGNQWARVVEHGETTGQGVGSDGIGHVEGLGHDRVAMREMSRAGDAHSKTTGWRATCGCNADVIPATVLDPFAGTFTTWLAAQKLGRRAVGLDISEEYL